MAIAAARTAAGLPAGDLRVGASNTVQIVAAVAVVVSALRRRRQAAGSTRMHLLLVAAGAGAWGVGQTYWTVAQAVLHVELPFPAPSDAAFLALIPLMLAALAVAPISRFHATSRLRRITDGLVVAFGVMFVVWSTVLSRVLENVVGTGVLAGTVSVAYPTGDMLVVSALGVALLGARPGWAVPLVSYLLAFTALLAADGGFAYLAAGDGYATGSWVDTGWTAGMALLLLGVRHVPLTPAVGDGQVLPNEWGTTVLLTASFGATVVAVGIEETNREPLVEHPLLVVLLLGTMSAVMVRAMVARREGEAYASELVRTAARLGEVQEEHDLAFAAAGITGWTWSASDGRWSLGDDGPAAPVIAALVGSTEEVLERVDPADRERVRAALAAPTPDEPGYDLDFGVSDGVTRAHVRTRGRARHRDDGGLERLTGVVFDVTESHMAREAIRRRDENLAELNAFSMRTTRTDEHAAVLRDAVETLGSMLGTRCEVWQVEGDPPTPTLCATWAPPRRPEAEPRPPDVRDGATAQLRWEIVATGRPWGYLSVETTASRPLTAEAEALAREVAGIVAGSVERSAASLALWREARYDSLTGLPNRLLLGEELATAMAHPDAVVALLYLDLDGFKEVNDTYGHAIGDQLLVVVAQRLGTSVRPTDLAARLGGDEFAIMLPGLAAGRQLDAVLDRVRRALSDPVDLGPAVFHPRASIGVATTEGLTTAGELLRNADLAMYVSKAEGSGQAVAFDDRFHRDAVERGQLADELRHALERGELVLHYQPVVDLGSGRVVGAEALLRWARPGVGVVPPVAFLDAAVTLGLMEAITDFVITEACEWTASYVRRQPDRQFVIEVNVAPSDIGTLTLVPTIRAALDRSGLDPARLCLEVTESAVIHESPEVLRILTELRDLGVGMAIDDFGTGYSSMRQLKALPVDIVKIDQGFVDGLGTELDDSTIVAAVVDMAHTLSLSVIAEGVETERQRDALVELGCEMAQGYLFGRPVPGDVALEDLLTAAAAPLTADDHATRARSVVIADDLDDDRRLLTRQLTRSGRYRVLGEAADGAAAVRMVHELDPDLVLLDLNMPELDGLNALARIRADSPRTEVVMLSGFATSADETAATAAGARGCIAKGPSNVVAALDEVLGRRPAQAPGGEPDDRATRKESSP